MVRPALRFAQSLRVRRLPQSKPAQSRSASTGSEEAQKKAQDALATAQKYAGEALEKGRQLLGPVGDKIANLFGAYRQPITYNFQVAREFLKHVYVAERLQPPTSLSQVQSAYSTIWSRATNPQYWKELRANDYKRVGVYALEAYGIFKIGEIIGRRSLVGYNVN